MYVHDKESSYACTVLYIPCYYFSSYSTVRTTYTVYCMVYTLLVQLCTYQVHHWYPLKEIVPYQISYHVSHTKGLKAKILLARCIFCHHMNISIEHTSLQFLWVFLFWAWKHTVGPSFGVPPPVAMTITLHCYHSSLPSAYSSTYVQCMV